MKYLIFEYRYDEDTKQTTPVVFPTFVTHKDMANTLLSTLLNGYRVVSAGFVVFTPTMRAYGRSDSLNIDSHADDLERILKSDWRIIEDTASL